MKRKYDRVYQFDPFEVNKILECLKRNNAPPFDKVVTKAS